MVFFIMHTFSECRNTSHLLTYPPLHFVMCRIGSLHASVLGPLPPLSSSGFWPHRLLPGLAISALVCLEFAFHLPSSTIYFSWHHLYLAFAHVQTISTSSLRNSAIGYMCASFQNAATLMTAHQISSPYSEQGHFH